MLFSITNACFVKFSVLICELYLPKSFGLGYFDEQEIKSGGTEVEFCGDQKLPNWNTMAEEIDDRVSIIKSMQIVL